MSEQLSLGDLVRREGFEKSQQVRREGVEALYKSATIGGFGVLLYGSAWMYSMFSDATLALQEVVTKTVKGAEVNPIVFSEAGYEALLKWHQEKEKGWLAGWNVWDFRDDYQSSKKLYEETGRVPATPWELNQLAIWERHLIDVGLIPVEGAVASAPGVVHPLDKLVGLIMGNRNLYFSGVLGLMAIPAIPVVRDVVSLAKGEEK